MAGSSTSRFVFPAVALTVLAVAVVALWNLNSRAQKLEHSLKETEQRASTAQRQVQDYARELSEARQQAGQARERASEAEEKAQAEEMARREAEMQSQEARRHSEAATETAQHALAEKSRARDELYAMRERRERELNRMKEAFSRIAPTRRTPSGMVVELADQAFQFDFDKAVLRPENRETLSRIAGILLASDGYRLFIDGHTDDIGTQDYNLDLSRRRAESVRDYLAGAGIPEEIMKVQGFGKSNPLVNATSPEARQKNRRVEIGIVDTIIDYKGEVETAGRGER